MHKKWQQWGWNEYREINGCMEECSSNICVSVTMVIVMEYLLIVDDGDGSVTMETPEVERHRKNGNIGVVSTTMMVAEAAECGNYGKISVSGVEHKLW